MKLNGGKSAKTKENGYNLQLVTASFGKAGTEKVEDKLMPCIEPFYAELLR